jgi:hypothetical protein
VAESAANRRALRHSYLEQSQEGDVDLRYDDACSEPVDSQPRLQPGVMLGTGEEPIVFVPGKGSFLIDPATYGFLLAIGRLASPGETEQECICEAGLPNLQARAMLVSYGILAEDGVSAELASGGESAYCATVADLVLKKPLPGLEWALSRLARFLGPVWSSIAILLGFCLAIATIPAALVRVPSALLVVMWIHHPLTVVVATFLFIMIRTLLHELGHIAAAQRAGVRPMEVGVGFYLNAPVLYVDLSPADVLPKRHRVTIDLAGVAIDGFIAVALCVTIWGLGIVPSLGQVLLYDLAFAILTSLNPLTRSDLNWALRDKFGVRGLTLTWATPRKLIATAVNRSSGYAVYARFQLVAALVYMAVTVVIGILVLPEVLATLLRTQWSMPMIARLMLSWGIPTVGLIATWRVLRQRLGERGRAYRSPPNGPLSSSRVRERRNPQR